MHDKEFVHADIKAANILQGYRKGCKDHVRHKGCSLTKIIPKCRYVDPPIIDLQLGLMAQSELHVTWLLVSTDDMD